MIAWEREVVGIKPLATDPRHKLMHKVLFLCINRLATDIRIDRSLAQPAMTLATDKSKTKVVGQIDYCRFYCSLVNTNISQSKTDQHLYAMCMTYQSNRHMGYQHKGRSRLLWPTNSVQLGWLHQGIVMEWSRIPWYEVPIGQTNNAVDVNSITRCIIKPLKINFKNKTR